MNSKDVAQAAADLLCEMMPKYNPYELFLILGAAASLVSENIDKQGGSVHPAEVLAVKELVKIDHLDQLNAGRFKQ